MATYDDRDPAQRQAMESIYSLFHCGVLLFPDGGERRILFANERLPALFGCTQEEFAELYPAFGDCVFPDDRAYVEKTVAQALKERDSYDLVYRVLDKDGGAVWVKECGHRVTAPGAPAMVLCTLTDISSDGDRRQALENRDAPDPLTHVLSGDAFTEQVRALLRAATGSGRRHALLLVDVDRFMKINETFGHAFGDKVLSDIAQTLRTVIRTGDLLGRLGGDEFGIFLKDVKTDASFHRRLEHIRSLLHKPLPEGTEISSGIGVAVTGEYAEDYDTLFCRADAALHAAKAAGGNRVAY